MFRKPYQATTHSNTSKGIGEQATVEHDKDFKIIVNGTEQSVERRHITFEELVNFAFPGHPNDPNLVFSVTFDDAQSKPHQGTLGPGGSVTIEDKGTVFDVTQTNRS